MRYYSIIIVICLIVISCKDSRVTKLDDKGGQSFTVVKKNYSYDSISNLLKPYRSIPFYSDANYSLSNYDSGEWGGFIEFKDSTTKNKYVFPTNSIFQMYKLDSGYLVYSHSNHGSWGSVLLFSKPKQLYNLTNKKFTLELEKEINSFAETLLSKKTIVKQFSDINDSLYSIVGIFNKNETIYVIQSNRLGTDFTKVPPQTIISKINISNNTYEVVDTIMNKAIHTSNPLGYSCSIQQKYIPFEQKRNTSDEEIKRGFIIIKGDSIIVSFKK